MGIEHFTIFDADGSLSGPLERYRAGDERKVEAAEQRSHWGSKNCWVSQIPDFFLAPQFASNRTFWNIVTEPISSAQSSPGRLNTWTTGPNALVLLMPQAPRGGLPVFGASKELQRCQTWGLDVRGTV